MAAAEPERVYRRAYIDTYLGGGAGGSIEGPYGSDRRPVKLEIIIGKNERERARNEMRLG